MVDYTPTQAGVIPPTMKTRFKDMGDGTHAQVMSLGDTTDLLGRVGGPGASPTATPTVTAGAYQAKDAVGGKLTFADAAREAALGGYVVDVTIIDKAMQSAELVLTLFNQDFTATNDNDAFDPSDADLLNVVGIVHIYASDYQAFANNAVASKQVVLRYDLAGTALYGQLMCIGAPTYATTSDLKIKLGLMQD